MESDKALDDACYELASNQIICTKNDGAIDQIALIHASILDVYKDNIHEFESINGDVYTRL